MLIRIKLLIRNQQDNLCNITKMYNQMYNNNNSAIWAVSENYLILTLRIVHNFIWH